MSAHIPTPIEIDRILNGVALEHPVALEDCAAIREALGGGPEVFHRIREVVVQVYRDGKLYYQRRLPIAGAPPMKIGS